MSLCTTRDLGIHPRLFESSWIKADNESNTWMTSKIGAVASVEPHHLDFAHHIVETDGVLVFIYQSGSNKSLFFEFQEEFH